MTRSVVLGLALAGLVMSPQVGAAQGFHPRWEIPGFDISRDGGWRVKARRVAVERARLRAAGDFRALNAPAAAPSLSSHQVAGTIDVPMVLFYYRDTPLSNVRDTAQYNAVLFSSTPPLGRPYTLRTYYEQLSDGVFSMRGRSIGWMVLDSNEVWYTGQPGSCTESPTGGTNCNGLFSSDARRRMQRGLREALAKADTGPGGVDFRQFDSDGDGYVDMMGFAHATQDGACSSSSNNHIWAHRWVIGAADALGDFITNDPLPGGGTVRIRDYFIQSGLGGASACDETQIMPIGIAAHEFGHALALPDLYDTGGSTEGIGRWGLMGSGSFSSPLSPARMEAWSLDELGWVTLTPITAAGTYSLRAAPTADSAFLIRFPGSNSRGEYYLIENRQAVLADTALIRHACQVWTQPNTRTDCPGGLLIWHVDSTKVANGMPLNQVNFDPFGSIHGVTLEEADGGRDLWCPGAVPFDCNRGDTGDPYPGETGNPTFSFNTSPASTRNADGGFAGVVVDSIRQMVPGGEMAFRVRFGGLTVVRGSDTTAVVRVNGAPYGVFRGVLEDGSTHQVGMDSVHLSPDGRRQFTFVSWSDDLPREHDITGTLAGDTLIATVSREFRLVVGGGEGGAIASAPPLTLSGDFVAEGTPVELTATPGAGSVFVGWTGDTTATNPVLTLPMQRPYTVTATFTLAPLTADVVAHLLGPTAPLTADQVTYLDNLGNRNGLLDVGDFLAWVKETGAP